MPLEKGTVLHKGDVINLRGVVEYDWTDGETSSIQVKIPGTYTPVFISGREGLEAVTFLHSAFVKGDVVKRKPDGLGHYTVFGATEDGWVWCRSKRGQFATFSAESLVHVEPGEKEPAPQVDPLEGEGGGK